MIGVGVEEASMRLGDFVTGSVYWSEVKSGPIHVELRWVAGGQRHTTRSKSSARFTRRLRMFPKVRCRFDGNCRTRVR